MNTFGQIIGMERKVFRAHMVAFLKIHFEIPYIQRKKADIFVKNSGKIEILSLVNILGFWNIQIVIKYKIAIYAALRNTRNTLLTS